MSTPKRYRDTRIEVTRTVFAEYASRYHIKRGKVMDGWIDKKGNFRQGELTIYPTHFKVLGKFYFRKVR